MIDHSNQLDGYALQASLRKVHVDQMLNVPMHKIKEMQSCNNLMDQSLTSFIFPMPWLTNSMIHTFQNNHQRRHWLKSYHYKMAI